jgi:hypothetical protein
MKNLRLVLCALTAAVLVSLPAPTAVAQKNTLPPEPRQNSSLREILDYLNENFFPHARIGYKYDGPETYGSDESDPTRSFTLANSKLSEEVVLSEGFKLVSADGCELVLKNDAVRIVNFWTKSYDPGRIGFAKFIREGKNGEPPLKPQSAVVILALDQMSNRKGKGPYRHADNEEEARRVGTWRTKYKSRGFFNKSIVGMEVFAAGPDGPVQWSWDDTLTFTFDDKEMSQRFDAAFRRAIKLCHPK